MMLRKKTNKLTPAEQHVRFIETAKATGVDESIALERFERALEQIAKSKGRVPPKKPERA